MAISERSWRELDIAISFNADVRGHMRLTVTNREAFDITVKVEAQRFRCRSKQALEILMQKDESFDIELPPSAAFRSAIAYARRRGETK
jgi:hypothetical protein